MCDLKRSGASLRDRIAQCSDGFLVGFERCNGQFGFLRVRIPPTFQRRNCRLAVFIEDDSMRIGQNLVRKGDQIRADVVK